MENDHCHKSLRVLQIKSSSKVGLTTNKSTAKHSSAVRSANLCELAFKRVAPTEVEKEVGLEDIQVLLGDPNGRWKMDTAVIVLPIVTWTSIASKGVKSGIWLNNR